MGKTAEQEAAEKEALEIKNKANEEADAIREAARQEALDIVNKAKSTKPAAIERKDERTKNGAYRMEKDNYTKYDAVKVKATEKAMFHVAGSEHIMHGEQAEPLIQKGEVEFVSIHKKGEGDKHALVDRHKPVAKK